MLTSIDRRWRRFVAQRLRGWFPGLYSTLDDPQEVPVQVAAYRLAAGKYVRPGDHVLDVGFGLGYGLRILSEKADTVVGIEIDRKAVSRARRTLAGHGKTCELRQYDGKTIPYPANSFDVVTCVDVIEHVPDYAGMLAEMVRVSRRTVIVSTPSRRPEHTQANGRPRNLWHLREWSYTELADILNKIDGVRVDWNVLDGPWDGPFETSTAAGSETQALVPALLLEGDRDGS
jgi:2-polyprenyl-3-methyl-5-hydroxy-6-metoxy-1,4-benzoquinol methylase